MARHVHLAIALTDPVAPGVLAGAVELRLRGVTVLDWRLTGLNGSALALARAATAEHGTGGEWPLFFDPDALDGRDAAADFAVQHHERDVTLSDFRACAVPREARFTVPWAAFAGAVLRVGDLVVRRSGGPAPGMNAADTARRAAWRAELRALLRPIRVRRRGLTRRPREREP